MNMTNRAQNAPECTSQNQCFQNFPGPNAPRPPSFVHAAPPHIHIKQLCPLLTKVCMKLWRWLTSTLITSNRFHHCTYTHTVASRVSTHGRLEFIDKKRK